jgi:hypothetical protein
MQAKRNRCREDMKMSFMAESSLSLNLHFFVDSIGGHCLAQDDALET